jgi:hypothetical protein
MANDMRKKLAKAITSGNQQKGRVTATHAEKAKCATDDKTRAKCSKGVRKETVTSVGS